MGTMVLPHVQGFYLASATDISAYTGTGFGVAQIKSKPQVDGPIRGSLAAEGGRITSMHMLSHIVFVGFDSVFIQRPSGRRH